MSNVDDGYPSGDSSIYALAVTAGWQYDSTQHSESVVIPYRKGKTSIRFEFSVYEDEETVQVKVIYLQAISMAYEKQVLQAINIANRYHKGGQFSLNYITEQLEYDTTDDSEILESEGSVHNLIKDLFEDFGDLAPVFEAGMAGRDTSKFYSMYLIHPLPGIH